MANSTCKATKFEIIETFQATNGPSISQLEACRGSHSHVATCFHGVGSLQVKI